VITLNTLRDQVRAMADLDETDLSDSVIDQFAKEGFQRIYALERRWPYLQTTFTTSTSAGIRSYLIENIGDIREIISIVDTSSSGNRFTLIDHNNAEEVPREYRHTKPTVFLFNLGKADPPVAETRYNLYFVDSCIPEPVIRLVDQSG